MGEKVVGDVAGGKINELKEFLKSCSLFSQ